MRWIVLLFALCLPHLALAQRATDEQLWTEVGVDADLGDRVQIAADQQLRLGADAGFVETHSQLEAEFKLTRAVRVAALYRYAIRDGERRHRLAGRGEVRLRRGKVTIGYRLTMQETFRPDGDQLVLRNRAKVAVDAGRRLEPFVSLELHHQLDPVAEFRELRLVLGTGYALSKKLDLAGYYMFQDEQNVRVPERNHVFGLGLTVHLGGFDRHDSGSKD